LLNRSIKQQLAFLLARQQIVFESGDELLDSLINSTRLSEHFLYLARELEILDPKTPDDIYKSHLEMSEDLFFHHFLFSIFFFFFFFLKFPFTFLLTNDRSFFSFLFFSFSKTGPSTNTNSAQQNLASTFVNAFVNAGFGRDKLMIEDGKWLYQNKDHGFSFLSQPFAFSPRLLPSSYPPLFFFFF